MEAVSPIAHQLVLSHLKNARKFAWRLAQKAGAVDRIDDIQAEAVVGLVVASTRFDPSRGTAFLTYAANWIRHYVGVYIDHHKHSVRPPSDGVCSTIAAKLTRTQSQLSAELGRAATDEELCAELECSAAELARARIRFRARDIAVSDTERQVDHYVPVSDWQTPEALAAEASAQRERIKAINRAMHRLNAKEREVIRRRRLADNPETLAQVAKTWGVSRERVRQIEAQALKVLRAALLPEQRRLMEVA